MKNLFDEDVNPSDYLKATIDRRKYIPLQEIYGTLDGKRCKNCKYFETHYYSRRKYFKCELMGISSSEASDIRANRTACKKYIEVEENE